MVGSRPFKRIDRRRPMRRRRRRPRLSRMPAAYTRTGCRPDRSCVPTLLLPAVRRVKSLPTSFPFVIPRARRPCPWPSTGLALPDQASRGAWTYSGPRQPLGAPRLSRPGRRDLSAWRWLEPFEPAALPLERIGREVHLASPSYRSQSLPCHAAPCLPPRAEGGQRGLALRGVRPAHGESEAPG